MNLRVRAGGRCAPATHPLSGLVASVAMLLMAGAPAWAYDWKITSELSQATSVDDNFQISPIKQRAVWGETSRAVVDAQARSKTHSLDLLANLGYAVFRGIDNSVSSDNIDNNLSATYNKKSKLTDLLLNGSYARQSTLFSEEEDTGLTGSNNTRITYAARTGLTRRINATDTVKLGASFSRATFEKASASLTPFESFDISAGLGRVVNHTMEVGLSASVGLFLPQDNDPTTDQTVYRLTANVSKKLLHNLSADASVGARFVEAGNVFEGDSGGGGGVGFPVAVGLSYKQKTSRATLRLSRSVSPSASGSLQSSSTASFAATHEINQRLSFNMAAAYSLYTVGADEASPGNADRTNYSVSSGLGYAIAPEWTLALTYRHRFQDTSAGGAHSNSVVLNLTHPFVPMP